mmetsp:Transcript_25244/g.54931  ORF Transcript_25244/g.54931 Transcript_25244/m.54931 type:complete len:92 (-) Transcript_25244:56-331(-)
MDDDDEALQKRKERRKEQGQGKKEDVNHNDTQVGEEETNRATISYDNGVFVCVCDRKARRDNAQEGEEEMQTTQENRVAATTLEMERGWRR